MQNAVSVFPVFVLEPRQDIYLFLIENNQFYLIFNDHACVFKKNEIKDIKCQENQVLVQFQDLDQIVFESEYCQQIVYQLKHTDLQKSSLDFNVQWWALEMLF
ncbi:Hypothetical_protein [Hexamita inflata]|uniref:Hypothetical_protein n=1 Tax=Hexamita inflata TaxID=28002 RepID=A0AA86UX64_9EUKA|nr:Hypothetical protein HINF_LOCUS63120 [Hexamita inflata]